MAYVLSQKLLDRIYEDLDRVETRTCCPQPSVSQSEMLAGSTSGWFVVTSPITLSGEGEATTAALRPCPDGNPYQVGYLLEPEFKGTQVKVYDTLWRCTTEVKAGAIVYCVKVDGKWTFLHSVNCPVYGSADYMSGTPSTDPTGDPTAQFVGKTTTAWAKGTTANITIYRQSGTTWSVLQATTPGQTTPASVTIKCYNRYADVATDKWVRVTGGGELVSAEC